MRLMGSSTPEPENAAPTVPVRSEQGQIESGDATGTSGTAQYKPRSKSQSHVSKLNPSLLSQALAASKESAAESVGIQGADTTLHLPGQGIPQPFPPPPLDDQHKNGLNIAQGGLAGNMTADTTAGTYNIFGKQLHYPNE